MRASWSLNSVPERDAKFLGSKSNLCSPGGQPCSRLFVIRTHNHGRVGPGLGDGGIEEYRISLYCIHERYSKPKKWGAQDLLNFIHKTGRPIGVGRGWGDEGGFPRGAIKKLGEAFCRTEKNIVPGGEHRSFLKSDPCRSRGGSRSHWKEKGGTQTLGGAKNCRLRGEKELGETLGQEMRGRTRRQRASRIWDPMGAKGVQRRGSLFYRRLIRIAKSPVGCRGVG